MRNSSAKYVVVCVVAFVVCDSDANSAPITIASQDFSAGAEISDAGGPQIVADNFLADAAVAASDSVTLRWWGSYNVVPGAFVDSFSITFYDNDDFSMSFDQPGAVIPIGALSAVTRDIETGSGAATIYEFSVQFDGLSLGSGDKTWISIVDASSREFSWQTGMPGTGSLDDFVFSTTGGSSWVPVPALSTIEHFAFQLEAESAAVVPEPTSFALLSMGALGFMGFGWQRRKVKSAEV